MDKTKCGRGPDTSFFAELLALTNAPTRGNGGTERGSMPIETRIGHGPMVRTLRAFQNDIHCWAALNRMNSPNKIG